MGTSLSEVADLFLTRVDDYRLMSIYNNFDTVVFNMYLEPWLLDAIVEFDVCSQDLTYTATSGSVEGSFGVTLTTKNKVILSQIMVKYWLAKTVSDILQMNNLIQDHDFKTYSQAQNLKSKQDYYRLKVEEIKQILNEYDYKSINWTNWKAQNFDGSA